VADCKARAAIQRSDSTIAGGRIRARGSRPGSALSRPMLALASVEPRSDVAMFHDSETASRSEVLPRQVVRPA
jgi:hypothetical protein